jgi:hypothetical protein
MGNVLDGRELRVELAKIPLTKETANDSIRSVSGSSRSGSFRTPSGMDDSDYDSDEEKLCTEKMSDGESSSSYSGKHCLGLPPANLKRMWLAQNLSDEEITQRRFDHSVGVCRVPTNELESGRMTKEELGMLKAKQEVS